MVCTMYVYLRGSYAQHKSQENLTDLNPCEYMVLFCNYFQLDYAILHQLLLENDITLHILMNEAFLFHKSLVSKIFFGMYLLFLHYLSIKLILITEVLNINNIAKIQNTKICKIHTYDINVST